MNDHDSAERILAVRLVKPSELRGVVPIRDLLHPTSILRFRLGGSARTENRCTGRDGDAGRDCRDQLSAVHGICEPMANGSASHVGDPCGVVLLTNAPLDGMRVKGWGLAHM